MLLYGSINLNLVIFTEYEPTIISSFISRDLLEDCGCVCSLY